MSAPATLESDLLDRLSGLVAALEAHDVSIDVDLIETPRMEDSGRWYVLEWSLEIADERLPSRAARQRGALDLLLPDEEDVGDSHLLFVRDYLATQIQHHRRPAVTQEAAL